MSSDGRGAGRLPGKVAVVMGGGQTEGETIGNGRASAITYAREGAAVVVVDHRLSAAESTAEQIVSEGGRALPVQADATDLAHCQTVLQACSREFGPPDILHNNVGIGVGDGGLTAITEDAWDHIIGVNMKSVLMPCKALITSMRERGRGAIVNISSVAAIGATRMVAYKASKAGINAMTQQLALTNARFGIRVNAIMPGLMDTPMAIEGFSEARGMTREALRAERNARVPLNQQMGTGWDIANAAAFLVSDDARFITGVVLPVDGGSSARVG